MKNEECRSQERVYSENAKPNGRNGGHRSETYVYVDAWCGKAEFGNHHVRFHGGI